MIRTVGVTQVKYCYRNEYKFSTNTIYSICFPFESITSLRRLENDASKNKNLYNMVISLPSCAFENFFVTYWCIFRFEAENKKIELIN